MRIPHPLNKLFLFAGCLLAIAACTKANAPTPGHFKAAIESYIKAHPRRFAVHSGTFPDFVEKTVINNTTSLVCGQYVNAFGEMASHRTCSISLKQFDVLKSAGVYKQTGNVQGAVFQNPNPNYANEMAAYKVQLKKYNDAIATYNKQSASIAAKNLKIFSDYNAAIKKKIAWCSHVPPTNVTVGTACSTLIHVNAAAAYRLAPNLFPAPPVYLSPPAFSISPPYEPQKMYLATKMYPLFSVVAGNGISCSNGACTVIVGHLGVSKIEPFLKVPSSAPDGSIVETVRFLAKPVLNAKVRLFPKGPEETSEKMLSVSLVKETNGWTAEGPDGGLMQ